MDLATLVGLVLAFGLPIFAIFLGGAPMGYLDAQSFLIVIGGPIGYLLVSYSMERVMGAGSILSKALFLTTTSPLRGCVKSLYPGQTSAH